MRERLLLGVYPEQRECAAMDNLYVIKVIASVIARVFSEAISMTVIPSKARNLMGLLRLGSQ